MSKNVAFDGAIHGPCPINRFHNRIRATYCVANPSFRRRGHMLQNRCSHCAASKTDTHLKTPTLFASTPNLNVDESWGAVESNSVKGSRGSRIVFSWTWKEKRKKDIELLSNASSMTVCITGGTSVD